MAYGAPPLFRQGVSIRARFLFFLMLSLAVILVDGRLRALDDFRSALTSFLTPFKEVVQLPGLFIENSAGYFISKKNLNYFNWMRLAWRKCDKKMKTCATLFPL